MKKMKYGLFLILLVFVGCKDKNEPIVTTAKITLSSPVNHTDSIGIELNSNEPNKIIDFQWNSSESENQNTTYKVAFSLKKDLSNSIKINCGSLKQFGFKHQQLDSIVEKLGVSDYQRATIYWGVIANVNNAEVSSDIRVLKLFRFLKPLVDIRGTEQNTYRVCRIINSTNGKYAVWLADNLNTKKYSDGTDINPNSVYFGTKTQGETARLFGGTYSWDAVMKINHSPVVDDDMKDFDYSKFGVSDGYEVQGISPVGWHVPTVEEWNLLYEVAGGMENGAGIKLKSADNWLDNGDATVKGKNTLKFNAVGNGWLWTMSTRNGLADLYANFKDAYYWTSSFCPGDNSKYKDMGAWSTVKGVVVSELHFDNQQGGIWSRPPGRGLSVRCVLNAPAN